MKQLKHWQDAVNAVLGAGLALSPWAMGYAGETTAMANALVVGLALIAVALGAILVPRAWEEWSEAALGLWAIASPWLLGFAGHPDARLVAVVTGAVILVLALWTLATDREYGGWLLRHDRTAH